MPYSIPCYINYETAFLKFYLCKFGQKKKEKQENGDFPHDGIYEEGKLRLLSHLSVMLHTRTTTCEMS